MSTEPRYALDELLSVAEAAERIGITPRNAQLRATNRNLGRIIAGARILTPDDLAALAEAEPRGRRWPS